MLTLEAIPALNDNYIWVVHDTQHALIVDPSIAPPVLTWLRTHQCTLSAIFVTHHHHDHTGGINDLQCHYNNTLPVFGASTIQHVTQAVANHDEIHLAAPNVKFRVIAVPGHTRDHLAYYGENYLFAGDTLFACGCGRLFEGQPEDLYHSLNTLAALPPETLLCCAHEYTLSNQYFALKVDPENLALQQRAQRDQARRQRGEPTLPVPLAEELATNPFLRIHHPDIQRSIEHHQQCTAQSPIELLAWLREWKNHS